MDNSLRIGANVVDYALVFVYFAVVLLIGWAARRRVSDSLDSFLSGARAFSSHEGFTPVRLAAGAGDGHGLVEHRDVERDLTFSLEP